MLNLGVGAEKIIDGRSHILTHAGSDGHAIYGPYDRLEPGDYVVDFKIALAPDSAIEGDFICAWVDVAIDCGKQTVADDMIRTSQLSHDGAIVRLPFSLKEPAVVEYRLHVSGIIPLLIADQPVARLRHEEIPPLARPDFMIEQRNLAHGMYLDKGRVEVVGDHTVVTLAGVRFNARIYDDVNFVHELFVLNAYNILSARPTCVIDIGMNVAMAALQFATKDFVQEVHSFEPFLATYERGLANIALNPELANKITPHNFGLGDKDGDVTFKVNDTGDSGAMSTLNSDTGVPMTLTMRETSGALAPIIASAQQRGLDVILKVDCEGSEFIVFESLSRAGLLEHIHGFMVEWHRLFPGRTQHELIAPLLANGFIVFDVSPPTNNGFFYAVRAAKAGSSV